MGMHWLSCEIAFFLNMNICVHVLMIYPEINNKNGHYLHIISFFEIGIFENINFFQNDIYRKSTFFVPKMF